jgi:hypothetical protein
VEAAKTTAMLQRFVDAGIEDYNLLMQGNKSLLAEHDEFCYHSDDMENELVKAHSSAKESIADLEAKIKFVEAHSVDVAAASKNCLTDFEDNLLDTW